MSHAHGLIGGEALGISREVAHAAQRAGRDRRRVEHHDVRRETRAELTAVGEPEQVGLHLRQLVDGVLERQHALLPHPLAEEVGGEWRVAQLTDMGAGVGQSECAPFGLQQRGDAGLVVVGQNGPHPQAQVGFVEGKVEKHVERVASVEDVDQLLADQLGMHGRLHDLERVPTRREALAGGPAVTDPLAPRGIAVVGSAAVET